MQSPKEVLRDHANEFIRELRELQERKQFKASGASARSLNVKELSDDGYKIFGLDYWQKQETGNSPLDLRNTRLEDFSGVIEQWAIDKGLNINPFSVARSLKAKGDRLFRGERDPLGGPELFERAGKELTTKLIESMAVIFRTTIRANKRR